MSSSMGTDTNAYSNVVRLRRTDADAVSCLLFRGAIVRESRGSAEAFTHSQESIVVISLKFQFLSVRFTSEAFT